jgi:hypothetical protein
MAKAKDSDDIVIAPDGMGSLGNAVGLAAAETVCQVMGKNEITPHEIFVKRTDEVIWRVFLCNAPALAVLGIADGLGHHKVLANQQVPPPNPLPVAVMPPPAPPGRYVLIWTLFPPPGTDWQIVVEVAVNGATVFRQFKSAKSKLPVPRGFLFLEVQ